MKQHLLSIPIVTLLVVSAASSQELLKNPGFEELGANGIPTSWGRYGGIVPESRLETSADAHSGERSVRFLDTGPKERNNKWATGVVQDAAAEAGKYYLLSVWSKCLARNHDDAVSLQLRFLPSNKLQAVPLSPRIGGDWRRFSVAAKSPEGTTRIRVYIYTQHYWTCDCLIDDASLHEVDPVKWGARFPLLALGGYGIEKVRKLNLSTPITLGGKPAATILVPEGDVYTALGRRLAEAIAKRTGARLTVTTEGKPLVTSPDTVIALGNLNNNWVIERLHWNKYLKIDSLNPGPGRYVLQTVHEPFNGPKGKNVLVIGASDAGCAPELTTSSVASRWAGISYSMHRYCSCPG